MAQEQNNEFAELLREAFRTIKKCEGKTIRLIQDEFGYALGRNGGSAVERWGKGYLPPDVPTLEKLAQLIRERSRNELPDSWFRNFFQVGEHPTPEEAFKQLLKDPTKQEDQSVDTPPPPKPRPLPQVSDFVGRQKELEYFSGQLEKVGFAALIGMPGIGKTTLALQLARQTTIPEAVFWYSFVEGAGVAMFIRTLAAFLANHGKPSLWETLEQARLGGSRPPEIGLQFSYLAELLRGQSILLCLDDFQFLDDDPHLNDFLGQLVDTKAPNPRLLLTSRRHAMFISQASVASLTGLSLGDTHELLAQRQLFLPDQLVRTLHENTGGNPQFLTLAIDAMQQTLDPAQLVDRLAETVDIERFLMNQVNERLTAQEQAIMEGVSLLLGYAGTRDAIEFVINQSRIQATLSTLEQRHLLNVTHGAFGREYSQHAIVQSFYYEQTSRSQKRQLHHRAAEFYEREEPDRLRAGVHYQKAGNWEKAAEILSLDIWSIVNEGRTEQLVRWLAEIKQKHLQNEALWVKVLIAQGQLMTVLGKSHEAEECLREALSLLENVPETSLVQPLKAKVYQAIGELKEQESPSESAEWLQQGLAILDEMDSVSIEERALILTSLGTAYMHAGDYQPALRALQDALSLSSNTANPLRCNAMKNIGAIYFIMGDTEQAISYTDDALAMSRKLCDHFQTANILINSGVHKYVGGDWKGGIVDLENGLEIAERIGNKKTQASLLVNLGAAYINLGNDEEALEHLTKGYQLALEGRLNQIATIALFRLGDLYIRKQEWSIAEQQLARAKQLAEKIEAKSSLVSIIGAQAECALGMGKHATAYRLATQSVNLARTLEEEIDEGINLRILGQASAVENRLDEAIEAFSTSFSILEDEDMYEAMRTKFEWGKVLLNTRPDDAKKMIFKAYLEFKNLNANRDRTHTEKYLQNLC